MYLEHDASRLKSLVDRTADGLSTLPPTDRDRALRVLREIVYDHAVHYRGPAFADTFSALFLQAVVARATRH
jgi:hypothetical protein